ncbi:hypothetical protein BpHYR1_049059 [Brachionus plicatilis]|uniref:Uncharacterized protein n=1 Tax=Brachionus plicatilis TaxID=10195 RepID=A0A3M7SEI5_BRAPC|nr:hypothetical protein BpHYR1_049059 [Brachionus plicatilis]
MKISNSTAAKIHFLILIHIRKKDLTLDTLEYCTNQKSVSESKIGLPGTRVLMQHDFSRKKGKIGSEAVSSSSIVFMYLYKKPRIKCNKYVALCCGITKNEEFLFNLNVYYLRLKNKKRRIRIKQAKFFFIYFDKIICRSLSSEGPEHVL